MSIENSYNERELLEQITQGNETAFATLYNRYWNGIYSMALQYIKSPQAAQDIVQEVFVKIWLNKENLPEVREFKPYLFVAARNIIISSLRNKVFHEYLDEDQQLEEGTYLPEKQLSYKEAVDLLHRAIEQLPLQQQKAYQLSRYQGMRYDEIAQEMGISRRTVRNHITRALNFIRKYLTDNAVHPGVILISLFLK